MDPSPSSASFFHFHKETDWLCQTDKSIVINAFLSNITLCIAYINNTACLGHLF